jgi:uncharacterized protein YodC (DUF2158 family)
MIKQKYKFKVGEEVAHKDNLNLKLYVRRILVQTKELKPSSGDPKDAIEHSKVYIVGIECHWGLNNEIKIHKFHSRELVPWHVAQSGEKQVIAWIQDVR